MTKTEHQAGYNDSRNSQQTQAKHHPAGALVRVCAWCEQEFGPVPVAPGQLKTHGICLRHRAELLRSAALGVRQAADRFAATAGGAA